MSTQDNEADASLQRKVELFNDLDNALRSDDEDETPDSGRLSSMQAMQKAAARKQEKGSSEKHSGNALARSASDSSLIRGNHTKFTSDLEKDSAISLTSSEATDLQKPPTTTRHTFSTLPSESIVNTTSSSSATTTKATGKRKREPGIKQAAPEHQIFSGLRFYFFPNNDKNPARKMRIAKAIEYGASWEKEFKENVTHIIVDKSMEFALLKKFLKRGDDLPPHIVVVNESYPAECLTYKAIMKPHQPQFKVKGYDMPPALLKGASSGSNRSLQLKPAGKSVQARVPGTPAPPPVSSDDEEEDETSQAAAAQAIVPASVADVESTAEFDAAIAQARNLQHIPLDNDDDQPSRPNSSSGPATDDEEQIGGLKLLKQKSKTLKYQDKFSCMQKPVSGSGSTSACPNASTIAILQQMADYYAQIGDEWRPRAYRKAISTLRNHSSKVWTREEALALPQIGERLATKIEEIAFTDHLRRLDSTKDDPRDQVLQLFTGVYGVGLAQASKWANAGLTTLDQVLEQEDVTDNQRIGIEHYEDFQSRIPRAEVEVHGGIVRKALRKIDAGFEVIIGGSYRRGAQTSGDVDCIITHSNPDTNMEHIRQVVLDQLVPALFAKQFLVAGLASTSRDDGSKWHGVCCIPPSKDHASKPNPWRRIDLLLVPPSEMGAALIYFTGNDIFNRSMRLLASTKGMRLNQRGLYKDVMRGKGRVKLSDGVLVEGREEKRIFEVLGVPWREKTERNC